MLHYNKPAKLKYVDMAIYIDNRFKEYPEKPLTKEEEDTIYKYLYWLSYMLACKKRLLNKVADYEDFCKIVAGRYFIRLLDKRQWENPPGITPIKSILNYMKNTIYQMGVDFKQDNFCQVIDPENQKDVDTDKLYDSLRVNIQSQYNEYLESYTEEDIRKLPGMIKNAVAELNVNDKLIEHNMYLSCVLSFINTTTLSNRDMSIINRRFKKNQLDENYIMSLYTKSAKEPIILWHLDDSYNNQVELILNKVKIQISKLLKNNIRSLSLPEEAIQDIMWSSFSSTVGGDVIEE